MSAKKKSFTVDFANVDDHDRVWVGHVDIWLCNTDFETDPHIVVYGDDLDVHCTAVVDIARDHMMHEWDVDYAEAIKEALLNRDCISLGIPEIS